MTSTIEQLKSKSYDLIIVGGGINGAAIANMASQQGIATALLEKGDFASGTSSKSTKLLHGGIRYLEHLEFDLVTEALKERYIQWKSAPHLVKPLSFIIPVYATDPRPLWMMRLGVWLYDMLSAKYRIGTHRYLNVKQLTGMIPGLGPNGLVGAVEYFDAQMDDARLVLENVLVARQHGAHTANYTQVDGFIKEASGKVVGVAARDVLTGERCELRAKHIIACAGVWSDALKAQDLGRAQPRLRPTKGVHIVYKGQVSEHAFLIQVKKDNRIFFIIPWQGNSLIGTTDTDYQGDPDQVKVEPGDIDYLLQEARRVFPDKAFAPAGIITTFAGLRPLVHDKGHPSRLSRKHVIERAPSGVTYVMGGKYTTYRAIAEEALNAVFPHRKVVRGEQYVLYGSGAIVEETSSVAARFGIEKDIVRHLQGIYGARYMDVLEWTQQDPGLKEKICSCSMTIKAQVHYAMAVEMAKKPKDIIERRLGLHFLECPTGNCRRWIEQLL